MRQMMELNLDQRESRRLHYEAIIWHDNLLPEIFYAAKIYNLSKGGVYFESDQIIYPGEEISLTLKNPASPVDAKKEYLRVEIKWRKDLQNASYRFGYGARFINPVDTLVKSFNNLAFRKLSLQSSAFKYQIDPRKHPRKAYRKLIRFTSKNRTYRGLITGISRGGAFIASKNKFSLGQMIHVVIPGGKDNKNLKLTGWVVRLDTKGFGVRFDRRTGRDRRKRSDRRGSRRIKTHQTI
jgi:Tfp pilus assembly protein PilZ